MPIWWPFILTGILAGIASGMFGIGGGIIITPVLVLIFKMDQHAASGTCSAAIINVYDFIDDFISLWYESLYG